MKQRLAIARALLHDPPVLLLDEPYTGLDRQAARMLDAVLEEAGLDSPKSQQTVVLTTHNLERGLGMCRRVVLLIDGRIAEQMDEANWDLDAFQAAYEERTAG
jgi:ABC-type multidrug transport system ATPase subunit